jgi:plastocyanin
LNTLKSLAYFIVLFAFVMISVSHSNVSAQGINILRVVLNVDAGGGNSSAPINQFKPSVINITTNETLKWINPTSGNPYPHTITFISNDSNLYIPNMTVNIEKGGMNPQQIIDRIAEKLSYQNRNLSDNIDLFLNASVLQSSEQRAEFLDPLSNFDRNDAEYAINGTEKFVNSGLVWNWAVSLDLPKSFTVRFPVEGTYKFQCLLHPDMKVTVNVKPLTVMGISLK